jgi:AcrR family transcriptional regulator
MSAVNPSPARGRPLASDPRAVAAIGLRMFAQQGYANVTFEDIARATGVSRSTVRRYFPTKASILWDRTDAEFQFLRSKLADAPLGEEPVVTLCREMPNMLQYNDDEIDLLRTQIVLIVSEKTTATSGADRLSELRELILDFIIDRTGCDRGVVAAVMLAETAVAVGWRATVLWASSNEVSPARIQREAFDALRAGFRLG